MASVSSTVGCRGGFFLATPDFSLTESFSVESACQDYLALDYLSRFLCVQKQSVGYLATCLPWKQGSVWLKFQRHR